MDASELLAALAEQNRELRRGLGEVSLAARAIAEAEADLEAAQARAAAWRQEGRELAEMILTQFSSQAREFSEHIQREADRLMERGNTQPELAELRARARAEEVLLEAQSRFRAALSAFERTSGLLAAPLEGGDDVPAGTNVLPWPTAAAAAGAGPLPIEASEPSRSARAPPVNDQALVVESEPARPLDARAPVLSESTPQASVSLSPEEGIIRLHPLNHEPGGLRYRISGLGAFAALLAFERAVSSLPGVQSVEITPATDGAPSLTMRTAEPDSVVEGLCNLSGFLVQIDPGAEA